MSERQLISLLESQFNEADTSVFEVGEQRERNYRYYTLQPLGNEQDGRSHYISPDVFDIVETKKAYFDEVFLSGRDTLKFKPIMDGDGQEAKKRTAYVNMQLGLNCEHDLLRDCWHDAFTAKRCVILAEWEEGDEEYTQTLPPMPIQMAAAIFDNPRIIDVDTSRIKQFTGENGRPMVEGDVIVTTNASQVRLTLVQPERYFRDPNVAYVRDGTYAGFEQDVTRGHLIDKGYDPDIVRGLRVDYRFRREEEDNSRKAHDRSWTRRQLHQRTPEQEEITYYKTWTWVDISSYFGAGTERVINPDALDLYEIHWSQGAVLRWADGELAIKKATEIPFFEWTEHKVSHAEHGLAVSDVVAHTQKVQSVLKRLIIDNQQMRNTTRWEAVQGSIKNPRELLDNPIGGVVWSRQIGSVAPLATPELSPLTFNVIEMLDQDKEERSGSSRLAQGLNTDVIRYQNSADMVERLTNASNRRILRACRDFAQSFMVPLSQYIYRLGVRHDERVYSVEIQGQYEDVNPSMWPDFDAPMEVALALTPDAGDKVARSLLTLHMQILQDPMLASMYGPIQRHNLMADVFNAMGMPDTSQYLINPRSPEYQQMMQMQKAQQDKMMELQMGELQFDKWLKQSKEGRDWYKAQLDGIKVQVDTADKATDNVREDDKFEWQKKMDVREIELEEEQQRAVAIGGRTRAE